MPALYYTALRDEKKLVVTLKWSYVKSSFSSRKYKMKKGHDLRLEVEDCGMRSGHHENVIDPAAAVCGTRTPIILFRHLVGLMDPKI